MENNSPTQPEEELQPSCPKCNNDPRGMPGGVGLAIPRWIPCDHPSHSKVSLAKTHALFKGAADVESAKMRETAGEEKSLGQILWERREPYFPEARQIKFHELSPYLRDQLEADAQAVAAQATEACRRENFHKIHVPGVWKCHTCGFVQHRNTIHPNGVFADIATMEEPCPNEGDVMFPMTWEEMAKENQEFGIKLMDREAAKDREINDYKRQASEIFHDLKKAQREITELKLRAKNAEVLCRTYLEVLEHAAANFDNFASRTGNDRDLTAIESGKLHRAAKAARDAIRAATG